ncbi:hypothetical protein J3F83DRAFT_753785 [Trichoderma novae-zelandiae]
MPSLLPTLILAIGMVQAAVAPTSNARPDLYNRAVEAGLLGVCTCPNLTICLGDKSQCTLDNKGATICCSLGQRAINGKCTDGSAYLCSDGKTVCSGNTQCTLDNTGATLCCPSSQKGINGQCTSSSTNICPDGKNICSGATPQCTINVSVFVDSTGGAASNTICCANGQKALNGKCYAGNAKVIPCYQNGVCDWGSGYYCAWNAGNGDSKCCKLDEYYKGTQCVKKP